MPHTPLTIHKNPESKYYPFFYNEHIVKRREFETSTGLHSKLIVETLIQDTDFKVELTPLVPSSPNPSCNGPSKFHHTLKTKEGEERLIKRKASISPQSTTPWLASSKQALNQCTPFSPLGSQ